jgi:putative transposase
LIGLKKRWNPSTDEKRQLVERDNRTLSIRKQCSLLQLNRSVYYYQKLPDIKPGDQLIMNLIDEVYTEFPEYGVPRMTEALDRLGTHINHKKVERLMRQMGLQAHYPGPRTSTPHPDNKIFPYLLRGLTASHPNHIWGTDITYIRLLDSFAYLTAILDWYSRYIVAWTLSPTMEADFCVENLEKALAKAQPNFHNSDQGSQFTAKDYIGTLQRHPDIKISMDGRGSFWDNIFTERLWRTIKWNEVYVHDYQSYQEAEKSLGAYITKYNERRICSAIGKKIPVELYHED